MNLFKNCRRLPTYEESKSVIIASVAIVFAICMVAVAVRFNEIGASSVLFGYVLGVFFTWMYWQPHLKKD